MIGKKVKYVCKNCGWATQIRWEWRDLKPKRCGNGKCNTSFLASPDKLEVNKPKVDKVQPKKQEKKEEVSKSVKTSNSKKTSSKTIEQSVSQKEKKEESNRGYKD